MTTYGYANGSPLVYSDPEGMFAALVLRFAMRYALPQAGLRLGATHAVKRLTPRLVRGDIKRVVWRGPLKKKAHCPPSSKALGQSLEAAGHARLPGSAAHHIVAGNAPAALRAREVLRRFGIGINDAANGVFLPASRAIPNAAGAAVHSTVHTNSYYMTVNQTLATATTRAEAEMALEAIRRALLSGGL